MPKTHIEKIFGASFSISSIEVPHRENASRKLWLFEESSTAMIESVNDACKRETGCAPLRFMSAERKTFWPLEANLVLASEQQFNP